MNIGLSIALFFGVLSTTSPTDYAETYARECAFAFDFYDGSGFVRNVQARANVPPEFLFAIVAPEITQYHHLRDVVEQIALFALYTHSGRDYADFSVGIFQMKPSFAEAIEQEVRADGKLQTLFPEFVFSGEDTMPERRNRLKRLQSTDWQMSYLMAFAAMMERRFGKFENTEKDVILWAAAYNSGFARPVEELEKMCKLELFPRFSRRKHNYAQLSLWFYNELINR